jgi:hypothetical protein
MYPKNNASPERIAIGAVIQISDGAVQSSGVTVRVLPFGGSEADGGGTTAYSTDGVVIYTPTQAETNYTSFILIAKKTGCIPVSITIVTTAEATAGTVRLGSIANDAITAASIAADAITEMQSGLSTLTQTQVTGGAYALNSASFAFNASLDFTTTQKAATLARVTLVDTVTTNTDMVSEPLDANETQQAAAAAINAAGGVLDAQNTRAV